MKRRTVRLSPEARADLLSLYEWIADAASPDSALGYIDRLNGSAKLRPDSKMVVSRNWATPNARLDGALQLSRGLARVAAAAVKEAA